VTACCEQTFISNNDRRKKPHSRPSKKISLFFFLSQTGNSIIALHEWKSILSSRDDETSTGSSCTFFLSSAWTVSLRAAVWKYR